MKRNGPIVAGLSLGLLLCLSGCREKTTAEKVEESVAKSADATKDTFKEIGDDFKKVGEDIADGTKKAYEETKEAVKDATKK